MCVCIVDCQLVFCYNHHRITRPEAKLQSLRGKYILGVKEFLHLHGI